MAGDGQVTLGESVIKHTAKKIRRLYQDKILAGFAGSTADAFSLFSRFESKLEQYHGNIGRAAVDAFKAGSDLLLIPADLEASYKAMLEAVKSGEISRERLDSSVLKLLKAKASLGLHKARLVDVDQIATVVGKPENLAAGQDDADAAVTLVRDNGKLLPLKHVGTVEGGLPYQRVQEVRNGVVAVIFSDDMRLESGRVFERQKK